MLLQIGDTVKHIYTTLLLSVVNRPGAQIFITRYLEQQHVFYAFPYYHEPLSVEFYD